MTSEKKYKILSDSLGNVEIPDGALWGIHTQRASTQFSVAGEKMPLSVIRAYLVLKKATTCANVECGVLSGEKSEAILEAIDDLLEDESQLAEHFPLGVWQSGSGAQTHMNLNEVIAHVASKAGKGIIHPHDDVGASQSTNDSFVTVMHMASVEACIHQLMPAISKLRSAFGKLETRYALTLKIGRTHLQDALPLTYGQMFSSYQSALGEVMNYLHQGLDQLFELPIGGTEVGTGFGAPERFDQLVVDHLSQWWKLPFVSSRNKFRALSTHVPLLHLMGCLSNLATVLNKIAKDIRLLASGPRSGIGELLLPEHESASAWMPGGTYPSQCESLSMVCVQVLSEYQAVAHACAEGELELNAYKPLIIKNILNSIKRLTDAMHNFNHFAVRGLMVHERNTQHHLESSLIVVSGLLKELGFDKTAEVAHRAYLDQSTIKEACLKLGYLTEDKLDECLDPSRMMGRSDEDSSIDF